MLKPRPLGAALVFLAGWAEANAAISPLRLRKSAKTSVEMTDLWVWSIFPVGVSDAATFMGVFRKENAAAQLFRKP